MAPQPWHRRVWDALHFLDIETVLKSKEYEQAGNLPLATGVPSDFYDPGNPQTMDHSEENARLLKRYTAPAKIMTKNEIEDHNQQAPRLDIGSMLQVLDHQSFLLVMIPIRE